MVQKVLQHLPVDGGVPHHALLAHLVLAGLELGLDEADHLPPLPQHPGDSGQDELQGYEAHVHAGEIRLLRHLVMGEIPGVGPLQAHHPAVAPEAPGQLAVAHVHGVDLFRSVLEHTVGEAASGGADVHADPVFQVDGPEGHGLLQLEAAPADIAEGVPPDLHGGVLRHRGAGFVNALAVDEHRPAHNGRLGLLAGLLETRRHQIYIQS